MSHDDDGAHGPPLPPSDEASAVRAANIIFSTIGVMGIDGATCASVVAVSFLGVVIRMVVDALDFVIWVMRAPQR